MSFVAQEYGGAKVEAPHRRTRLTDRDIRRLRSTQMYAQRLSGWTTAEIAVYFRVSPRLINMDLKAMPTRAKAIVEGMYRRGEISVA